MMKLDRAYCACFVALVFASLAHANNDEWKNPTNGFWGTNANWVDGSTPGIGDQATFDKAGTYTVTFNATPTAIQDLFVSGGNVTLTNSSGITGWLNVNSAGGGQDVVVSGATLTLKQTPVNGRMYLVAGDDLHVQLGGILNVSAGGEVSSADLFDNAGGTITVDGAGSGAGTALTVHSSVLIGGFLGTSSLTFQNHAQGYLGDFATTGTVTVGSDGAGILNVDTGAVVNVASLSVGTGSDAGTININSLDSRLAQYTENKPIVVGAASGGGGTINIGTATSGGTFSTSIGLTTINANGVVNVGSATTSGTYNANGDLTLGGKINISGGSTVTLQTLTASGGTISLTSGTLSYIGNLTIGTGGLFGNGDVTFGNNQQVTLTGSTTVDPAHTLTIAGGTLHTNSLGINGGQLIVGTNGVVGEPLSIAGGGLAAFAGASGLVGTSVTGSGSLLNLQSASDALDSGATWNLSSGGGLSLNGDFHLNFGTISVDGAGSQAIIAAAKTLRIGDVVGTTTGVMNVTNDGSLTVGAGGTLLLTSHGTLNINGGTADLKTLTNSGGTFNFIAGSLNYLGNLTVGTGGLLGSNLTLNANQQLTLSGTTTVDASRALTLAGGTLNTGSLAGTGTFNFINGTLGITSAAVVTIGSGSLVGSTVSLGVGDHLNVSNTLHIDGAGRLTNVAGNALASNVLIDAGGRWTVSDGVQSVGTGLVNHGTLVLIDTTINGPVTSPAGSTVTIVGGVAFNQLFSGAGQFFGPGTTTFNGGFHPGDGPATVNFQGSVTLGGGNTLAIELGGPTPGAQYDQMQVAGQLSLGGTLAVSFINGFTPGSTYSFDILNWGALSGTFSTIVLPTLSGGLAWNASQLYTAGILSIDSVGLPGDYNHNGIVDAADYVVWRKGLGTTYSQADYNVWRAHFGQTAGGGAGAGTSAVVPEPTTAVMLISATLVMCSRRRAVVP